jgi:hypothetical protein
MLACFFEIFFYVLVVVAACKQEICMLSIDVYEKNTCYWSDIYSTSSIISFPFRHMILEASAASIISNKYARDDANMGHWIGPSNGMQVYLLCFHLMTKQSLISKTCFSTEMTFVLTMASIAASSHIHYRRMWWTGSKKGFVDCRVVRQRFPYDSGLSKDWILVETRFSTPILNRPWIPPSLL